MKPISDERLSTIIWELSNSPSKPFWLEQVAALKELKELRQRAVPAREPAKVAGPIAREATKQAWDIYLKRCDEVGRLAAEFEEDEVVDLVARAIMEGRQTYPTPLA